MPPSHILIREAEYKPHGIGLEPAAVGPITMSVERGEFVSVVGSSHSGKSTLIKMMAGLLAPSRGEVRLFLAKGASAEESLGIVFRRAALLPWRSILANVLLQVELRGLDTNQYVDRARQLLALVGLSDMERLKPHLIAGSLAQRVSLCRALLHSPSLLLLDEPFGDLDSLESEELASSLQRFWMQQSMTVVLATCSITEAVQLSDRVAVMSRSPGRIVQTIAIDMPRPRRLDKSTTPQIAYYCNLIRTAFRAEGILS